MTELSKTYRRYERAWAIQLLPLWDAPPEVLAWLYDDGPARPAHDAALAAFKRLEQSLGCDGAWPSQGQIAAWPAWRAAAATYCAAWNAIGHHSGKTEDWNYIAEMAADAIGAAATLGRIDPTATKLATASAMLQLVLPLARALRVEGYDAEAATAEKFAGLA